ncbi:MAG TPA: hypothetical protein VIY54_10005 [Steroidobacteraceae bacterium]
MTSAFEADRRKRVRRTAIVVGLIAAAFYVGFIVMSVVRATS